MRAPHSRWVWVDGIAFDMAVGGRVSHYYVVTTTHPAEKKKLVSAAPRVSCERQGHVCVCACDVIRNFGT